VAKSPAENPPSPHRSLFNGTRRPGWSRSHGSPDAGCSVGHPPLPIELSPIELSPIEPSPIETLPLPEPLLLQPLAIPAAPSAKVTTKEGRSARRGMLLAYGF
jgi:hypothetical protein